jgi:hypothetical protein
MAHRGLGATYSQMRRRVAIVLRGFRTGSPTESPDPVGRRSTPCPLPGRGGPCDISPAPSGVLGPSATLAGLIGGREFNDPMPCELVVTDPLRRGARGPQEVGDGTAMRHA